MHRFYLPSLHDLVLTGAEARHCHQVLRLPAGATVNVFDGRGQEAQCRITETAGGVVRLAALQQSRTPPLAARLTLAQAIPRQNMDWIVQKATELGVATIQPLLSERTVVRATDHDAGKVDRWQAIALEACKQSGNNWLPEIQPLQTATAFLGAAGTFDLKLVGSLQPDARRLQDLLADRDAGGAARPASVLLLIGPEGDFTPAELAQARSAGCQPLSLGPLVLRADTAALYALSILHHELL